MAREAVALSGARPSGAYLPIFVKRGATTHTYRGVTYRRTDRFTSWGDIIFERKDSNDDQ